MSEETTSPKLLQDYEVVRRREIELMTDLIDILPKIDNLDPQWVGQVRDAMFHADHPYMMAFVGPFNSGKSSLINALVGSKDLLKIGPTPVTDQIAILRHGDETQPIGATNAVTTVFHPSPLLRKVSFIDTPGLESIFREHEETTNKFLHRADMILLVMLATQAMTQSNLEYLQTFREFGKKVILVINQCDLLTDEEHETVRQYVSDQSKDKLGFKPEVWMVSAKWGHEAQASTPRDAELWAKSGLGQIESFVEMQLSDAARLRQKLQTPLQIVQNAQQTAVATVKKNQTAYDAYRAIGDNVERQLTQQKGDLQKTVRETNNEIALRFKATIERADVTMKGLFNLANVLRMTISGILEATFIAALFRGGKKPDTVTSAFQKSKVTEPLDDLSVLADKLAPRLEGQDMRDFGDLSAYARQEAEGMPPDLRGKLIGVIAPPISYDRSGMMPLRSILEPLELEARSLHTKFIETARRNTVIYLALWQIVCLVLFIGLVTLWGSIATTNELPIEFGLLITLILASLCGFAFIPFRGRLIQNAYANQLYAIQARYTDALSKASDAQIEYGMLARRDVVNPMTRLIESQTAVQSKQLAQLMTTEQTVTKLEADLNALGKRRMLGLAF